MAVPDDQTVMRRSCIPSKFWGADEEDFNCEPALRDIFADPFASLFFFGPTGSGKTHAAAAFVKAHSWVVFYARPSADRWLIQRTTGFDYMSEIFREINDSHARRGDVCAKYSAIPMLVFDDIMSAKVSEYALAEVCALIDKRIENKMQTIVTSNLSISEIDAMDSRLASRLASFKDFKFDHEDRRLSQ